jgi:hypothetical protein
MKKLLMSLFISLPLYAYVPTVESLFRHGANPDVTANAILLSGKVSVYNPFDEDVANGKTESLWVKWVYNITQQNRLKLTQLVYRAPTMTEASLVYKSYVADLTPQYFNSSSSDIEKGLFFSMLNSLLINDGSFMVEFLRSKGVDVKLNQEIINHEKKSLMHRYKAWLIKNKGGRGATEDSPLTPASFADREKVDQVLSSSMYLDTKQVVLARHQGEPAWQVKADAFEAWINDEKRELRQMTFKNGTGETNIQLRDFIFFGGTNAMPRSILLKGLNDQYWQIEILGVKQFNETISDLLARLKRYDQILQHKQEVVARPAFML